MDGLAFTYCAVVSRLGTSPDLLGLVAPVAFMGAPTIIAEKLVGGLEVKFGLSLVQKMINAGKKAWTHLQFCSQVVILLHGKPRKYCLSCNTIPC